MIEGFQGHRKLDNSNFKTLFPRPAEDFGYFRLQTCTLRIKLYILPAGRVSTIWWAYRGNSLFTTYDRFDVRTLAKRIFLNWNKCPDMFTKLREACTVLYGKLILDFWPYFFDFYFLDGILVLFWIIVGWFLQEFWRVLICFSCSVRYCLGGF